MRITPVSSMSSWAADVDGVWWSGSTTTITTTQTFECAVSATAIFGSTAGRRGSSAICPGGNVVLGGYRPFQRMV